MSFNSARLRTQTTVPAVAPASATVQETVAEDAEFSSFEAVNVLNPGGDVSEEFAVLSTGSSSFGEKDYSIRPSNSRRIDEWVSNNELLSLSEEDDYEPKVLHIGGGLGKNTYPLVARMLALSFARRYPRLYTDTTTLTATQKFTIKQLVTDMLPYLKTDRPLVKHSFPDIPSIFPHKDLLLAYCLQVNRLEESSEASLCDIPLSSLDSASWTIVSDTPSFDV